jgi:tripartite-type tricarboxylate transporter receptor subunit TctC
MTKLFCILRGNRLAQLCAALLGLSAITSAQAQKPPGFPTKPVRVIIGTAPGGSTDFLSRTILGGVAERWGASFIMENHSSLVGGILAMDATLKAPADGYTILTCSGSTFQNAVFIAKVPYDVRKAFTPVMQFTTSPLVMGSNASRPYGNIKELIAYAKANPGKVNLANSGIGTSAHLSGALFKHLTGTVMQDIPYKGVSPSVLDTVAGRTDVVFGTSVALLPHVRSGKLKLLGITSPERMPTLPDVPTIAEEGVPGFAYIGWIGAVAKTGTPPNIVNAINKEAIGVIKSPQVQKALSADGSAAAYNSPEQFRVVIDSALDRVEQLIKQTGLKLQDNR